MCGTRSISWSGPNGRSVRFSRASHPPPKPSLSLESAIGSGPSSSYKGWDGLIQYFKEWFEPFGEYRMRWLDYVEAGERVLVPMKASGVGSASGLRVEMELVLSYELQDGMVTRLDQYDTLEQAFDAAGLSE
jgi:SnoaL-like domain